MDEQELLERFEEHRPHLRAVAYRMLGSLSEADDAVQEAWLRTSRADVDDVENLGGWLTTVTARVCLNLLRSRRRRHEEPLAVHVSDPIVSAEGAIDPEHEAMVADSVGLALLVVLEMLAPAERLAFVLHDMFAVPFEEIAEIVGRTPTATRQLASRARRRVQGAPTASDTNLAQQRVVVDAFFAAARDDIVLRSDGGPTRPGATTFTVGAAAVASRALAFGKGAASARPAVINGVAGVVVAPRGRPVSVMAFTIVGGKVVAIDVLADPERLARLDLAAVD
jgi:RNA polymerase sigma factor (sigma-70 family)